MCCSEDNQCPTCSYFYLFSHQEQTSRIQTQLNEEEMKNTKLLQQIAKLEAQITVLSQECEHKDEVDPLDVCLFTVWSSTFGKA